MPHDGPDIAEGVHQAIRSWIDADATRGLLILLDEADAFLDADAAGNRFAAVDRCRRLMLETNRRVKFVFAGLHRTARFDSLPNQPLSHLGQITVGPLAPRHAHDLITRPLEALGLPLPGPGRHPRPHPGPGQQHAGAAAAVRGGARAAPDRRDPSRAGTPPSLITDEDVDTVWDDADLRRAFRDKYVLTLNLDHRYLVIAYTDRVRRPRATGPVTGMTLASCPTRSAPRGPKGFASCGADDFRALVTECVDLGLLTRDGNAYRMRTPTVLRLLGTQDEVIDTLVTATERLVVPDATVVGSYRRRTHAGRSPLTERQLADVLAGLGSATLVTGCEATGLGAVADALRAALESKDVTTRARSVQALASANAEEVTDTVKNADPGTVVVIDARGTAPGILLELSVAAEKAATGSAVGAVLLADASSASAWSLASRRVSLARIDLAGLRLLCDEEGLPFHNDDAVARLYAATGGWPELVAYTLSRSAGANPALTADAIVTAAREHATAHRAALVKAALPARTPFLGLCFDKVAEFTSDGPEDRDAVVELMCMDDEATSPSRRAAGAPWRTRSTWPWTRSSTSAWCRSPPPEPSPRSRSSRTLDAPTGTMREHRRAAGAHPGRPELPAGGSDRGRHPGAPAPPTPQPSAPTAGRSKTSCAFSWQCPPCAPRPGPPLNPAGTTFALLSNEQDTAHAAARRRPQPPGRRPQSARPPDVQPRPSVTDRSAEERAERTRAKRKEDDLRAARDRETTPALGRSKGENRSLRVELAEAQEALAQSRAQLAAAQARSRSESAPAIPTLADRLAKPLAPRHAAGT